MLDVSKYTPEQLEKLIELLKIGMPAQEELGDDQRPALELLPALGEADG
jgi:hypothetical protein